MGFFKRKFSQKQSDFVLHQLSRTSRDSIRVSSGLRICEEIVDLRFEDDRFVTHYDHLLAKAAEAFALARKCGWTFESLGLLFEQMAEKIHSELNSQVTQALKISVWDVRVDLERHLSFSPAEGSAKKWAELTDFDKDCDSPIWVVLAPKRTPKMVNYLGDPVNVGDLGSAYSQIQAICNAMQPLMEKDVTLPSFEIEEPQSLGSDIRKKRPDPQPFGVSPRGAEYYCAQWMDFLGFDDVLVTERTRDGGYDIGAKGFVAQVKNFTLGKVSVVEVRQIYGVAQNLKVSAIVFSATGATTDAQTFCNEAGIGLFQFDSEAGSLWPVNETAAGFIQLIRREVECKRGLLTLIEQIQPYYLEALGDFREIVRAQGELFNLHARLPARIASRVSDLATLVRVFTNEVNVELMTDSSELAGPRLKAMASFASKYPPFQAEVQDLLSEVADLATIHRDSEELPE